jgi:serine/threonine protein kinase
MAPEVFKALDPKNDMKGLNFSKVDLWAAGNVLFRFIKSKGNNTGFVPYYNQFSSSDLSEIFNNSTNFVGTENEISGCVTKKKDLTMPSIEDADARLVLNLLINLLKVDPKNRNDLTEIMDDNLNQLLSETSRLDAAAQTIIDHFNPPLTES